jgi:hypothetical protein
MKHYRVAYQNAKEIVTGREFAILQQSGVNVKKLRNATKEEHDQKEKEDDTT